MFEILNAKSQQITTAFRRKQINDSEYDKLTTTLNATRREIAEITHQNTKKTVSLTIHRRPFIDWAFMCVIMASCYLLSRTKEVESFNEVYNTDDYLKLCILETIEAHVNDLRTQLISAIIARSPCLAQWIATAWVTDVITLVIILKGWNGCCKTNDFYLSYATNRFSRGCITPT